MLCVCFVTTFFILIFTACGKNNENPISTTENESVTISEKETSETGSENEISEVTKPTESKNGSGGSIITVQKYRSAFYTIPYSFVEIVGKDTYNEWEENIDYHPGESEEMLMLKYVQDFNISREDFDKANLKSAKIIKNDLDGRPCINPKDYANQEDDEIYNADIIYTFDEELIKNYYLGNDYPYLYNIEFDEAVEKGEYTPQTDVWVDVAQMEADIIAKYGSVD